MPWLDLELKSSCHLDLTLPPPAPLLLLFSTDMICYNVYNI